MDININKNPELMLEEKVQLSRNIILSLQHILLMNVYVVPVIIASILGFTSKEASMIIQSTFLVSGITTLIQAKYFMEYP